MYFDRRFYKAATSLASTLGTWTLGSNLAFLTFKHALVVLKTKLVACFRINDSMQHATCRTRVCCFLDHGDGDSLAREHKRNAHDMSIHSSHNISLYLYNYTVFVVSLSLTTNLDDYIIVVNGFFAVFAFSSSSNYIKSEQKTLSQTQNIQRLYWQVFQILWKCKTLAYTDYNSDRADISPFHWIFPSNCPEP